MIGQFIHSNGGFATLIALIMVAMLTLLGLAVLSTSDDEVSIVGNERSEMAAFYAAEAGLEVAAAAIQSEYDSTGAPPLLMPTGTESLNRCLVTYSTVDDGPAQQLTLDNGSMAGLHALVKTFTIDATAVGGADRGRMDMTQTFEVALVPIFQFAVFYANDLFTTPASHMAITGRVHVNGHMYLQSSNGLDFNGRVTAAGGVHHGFPAAYGVSAVSGDVSFLDGDGNLVSMYSGGSWLDCDNPDWYNLASNRWDGMVYDEAFGQEELNLPLTTTAAGDPHVIIERGSGNPDSYEHKAKLKIIDGAAYALVSGVWQDITASLPAGTITSTSFYDDREDLWVNSTDLRMDNLAASTYFPSNGVIYSSDQRAGNYNVLRLTNGSSLGHPLSVFSENPTYVWGDYNTVDKKPAAIIADAVTFLSNSWSDANSHSSRYNYRTVSGPTTVNVSMITGDSDHDIAYAGGLANLPRFLEKWNGTTFTLKGSMVELWNSVQATGQWKYGWGGYYVAPTRDYRFDTDLNDPNKLPPETPVVRVFNRIGWQQEYVGY